MRANILKSPDNIFSISYNGLFKLLLAQTKTSHFIRINPQPVLHSAFSLPSMNGNQTLIFWFSILLYLVILFIIFIILFI